jgi:hypothetical protein
LFVSPFPGAVGHLRPRSAKPRPRGAVVGLPLPDGPAATDLCSSAVYLCHTRGLPPTCLEWDDLTTGARPWKYENRYSLDNFSRTIRG